MGPISAMVKARVVILATMPLYNTCIIETGYRIIIKTFKVQTIMCTLKAAVHGLLVE